MVSPVIAAANRHRVEEQSRYGCLQTKDASFKFYTVTGTGSRV